MVQGYIWAEVPDAHRHLVEPVNKGSQRLPLLLADTNQSEGV